MPNLAQITIAGHAGQDATLRKAGDSSVCDFSVAVNNRDNSTTWYRVSVWNKYGEIMSNLVKKGHVVTVIGDFQPRTYTAQDGTERVSYDIRAQTVIVAGEGNSAPQPDNVTQGNFDNGNNGNEAIPF